MTASIRRKTIFDTVRKLLGRGFRQSEVEALDNAIDAVCDGSASAEDYSRQDRVPCLPPSRIGAGGITLIKRFEGCARLRRDGLVEAYPDPASGGDPWTIGWGATGPGIGPGTVWTQEQCDARLERDLERYSAEVAQALAGAPTSQAQFDALVSFHYNTGAIVRATLTRKHKAGDYAGAQAEFARWNRASGRILKGLTRRRSAEASLYARDR
jgi:GH24 family phage-related lysozyme (muramidase)